MFQVQKELAGHEAVIVALFEEEKMSSFVQELDKAFEGQLQVLLEEKELSTKKKAISKVHSLGKTNVKRYYFVGLGKKESYTTETLRAALGKAFKTLQAAKVQDAAILLDSFVTEKLDAIDVAHIAAEVQGLGTYELQTYKSDKKDRVELEKFTAITAEDAQEIEAALTVGYVHGRATNSARTLVNMPPNVLTATKLAEYAVELAEKYDMDYKVLEKEEMEDLGMGALLAVNQGSVEPPKMIALIYKGKEEWTDVIGFVGKGITYDTGGYSLKPREGMVGMKGDMGGAAAVLVRWKLSVNFAQNKM